MDNNLENQKNTALKFIFEAKEREKFNIPNKCLEEIYDLFVKVSSGENINSSNKIEEILKKYHED